MDFFRNRGSEINLIISESSSVKAFRKDEKLIRFELERLLEGATYPHITVEFIEPNIIKVSAPDCDYYAKVSQKTFRELWQKYGYLATRLW